MSVRTGVPQPIPGMMPMPMGGMPPSPMGGMPAMGGMPMPPGMNPQMPGAPLPMGGMPPPMSGAPVPPMGAPGTGPSASAGTLPAPSSAAQRAGFAQFAGGIQNAPAPTPMAPSMPQNIFGMGGMPPPMAPMAGQMASMSPGSMPVPALPGRQPVGMAEGGLAGGLGSVAHMQDGGYVMRYDPSTKRYQAISPSGKVAYSVQNEQATQNYIDMMNRRGAESAARFEDPAPSRGLGSASDNVEFALRTSSSAAPDAAAFSQPAASQPAASQPAAASSSNRPYGGASPREVEQYITNASPQQRAFAEQLAAAGEPISLSRYGNFNNLPVTAKTSILREIGGPQMSQTEASLVDLDSIMSSGNPGAAANTALYQIRSSDLDTRTYGNLPGSVLYSGLEQPASAGGGIRTVMAGTEDRPRVLTVSGAGTAIGNVMLNDLRGEVGQQRQERAVQDLLNTGARLSDIQAMVPDVDLSAYAGGQFEPISGTYLRPDAAQIAAQLTAEQYARQPLDNFTLGMEMAQNLGQQIQQIQSQGGDPEYKATLMERLQGEAEQLAGFGFVVDPSTGRLVSRPEVPFIPGQYYPTNLQNMMSPETYMAYHGQFPRSRFYTGPGASQPSMPGGGGAGIGGVGDGATGGGGATTGGGGGVPPGTVSFDFTPPVGATYQPTTYDVPTFVTGMSDIYGVRPVTYTGPPEARISGILGDINLPPRPESINVFDWLGERVNVSGMREGGVAGRPFDGVSYLQGGGPAGGSAADRAASRAKAESTYSGPTDFGGSPANEPSGYGGTDTFGDVTGGGLEGISTGAGDGGDGRGEDMRSGWSGDWGEAASWEGGGGEGRAPSVSAPSGTTGAPRMSAASIAADTAASAPGMSTLEGLARRYGPDILGGIIGGLPGLAVSAGARMALSGGFGPATSQSGVPGLSESAYMANRDGRGEDIFEVPLVEDELQKAVEEAVVDEAAPVARPVETLDEIIARISRPSGAIAPMQGNVFLPQGSQFVQPMRDGGAVDYRAMARAQAERRGLDPAIFERLVERESGYDPRAVSPKGAMGLGQVMPATARDPGYGVKPLADPFDPVENLRFSADYLRAMLDETGGDYGRALAAYNAGLGRVQEADGIPDIKETREYVDYILNNRSTPPVPRPEGIRERAPSAPPARPSIGDVVEALTPAPRKAPEAPPMRAPQRGPQPGMSREERFQQLQAASRPSGGSLGAAADKFLSRLGMQ